MKNLLLKAEAAATLETLYQLALTGEQNGIGHIKLNKHNHPEGGFMPVSVELVGRQYRDGKQSGVMVAVAHYFEQQGDLVADPAMTFFRSTESDIESGLPLFIPVDFQDARRYNEAVIFENGVPTKGNKRMVSDLISFTSLWMKNIRAQQGIKMAPYKKRGPSATKLLVKKYKQAAEAAKEMGFANLTEALASDRKSELEEKLSG